MRRPSPPGVKPWPASCEPFVRRIKAAEQALERLDGSAQARQQYFAHAEQIVGEQMLRGQPDLRAWAAALNAVLEVELEAERTRTATLTHLRALETRARALQAEEAARGAGGARSEYLVEVTFTCAGDRQAAIWLDYLVAGAEWTPSYEARTRGQPAVVELATLATVRQTTGEDWDTARMVLSTAQPRENATPPSLKPLLVRARERENETRQILARSEEVKHTPGAGTGSVAPTGTAVRVAAQGLSVQMALPGRAMLPGDGQEVRMLLSRTRQRADLHLRTIPKLSERVFRVADLVNTTPFPLLPGAIDVYRGGDFVGRDELRETPVRGKLSVTLGIEERVQVRRQLVRDVLRASGLLGRGRRQEIRYRYRLVSHLTEPAEVQLVDHLPVSELDDVLVALEPLTTRGHTVDGRDGLINWRLRLAPGVEQRVDLGFRIDIPSRYGP